MKKWMLLLFNISENINFANKSRHKNRNTCCCMKVWEHNIIKIKAKKKRKKKDFCTFAYAAFT